MKLINSNGDYYFCSKCNKWHKFTGMLKDLGTRHINYFNKNKTNAENADYYYCSYHRNWHSQNRKDKSCLRYRLELEVSDEILNKYKNLKQDNNITKKQGSLTVQLGQKLHQWLIENSKYKVYYDHGDRNLPEVGEVKSIMVTENNEELELSDVDITISDENRNIHFIIEVEESSSTPKTVFGDIFTLLLAKKMRFHNEKFNLENAVLFLIISNYSNVVKEKTKRIINELRIINEIFRREKISTSIERIELILLNSKYEIPDNGFEYVKHLILNTKNS